MDSDIQNADRFLSAVQPSLDNKRNNMPDGMQDKLEYFPINLRVGGRAIAVCGATEDSLAKVRLLLKTAAQITVYHDGSDEDAAYHTFLGLAAEQKIELVLGEPSDKNLAQAVMGYIGYEQAERRQALRARFVAAGTAVCLIDDKAASDFITPAIIDRAPITIAIGSEGLAPVMVRRLKSQIEKILPVSVGPLARLAGGLREAASSLPKGAVRRRFWTEIFEKIGPKILSKYSAEQQPQALRTQADKLINDLHAAPAGTPFVTFVSAGPGHAGMLTRDGEAALHQADIVLHDRLVSPSVLELCRREARFIDVGKKGFGPAITQSDINQHLIEAAKTGQNVVRLKGGDAGLFGRLDEETGALHAHNIGFVILPGVTSAAAMAAQMGISLSQRGRNRRVSFCTGYQLGGYADQDWRQLAEKGAVTAIYMGRKAASFVQGRLLMFGAAEDMPVTIASSVGCPQARWTPTNLANMTQTLSQHDKEAPLLILLGLHPHESVVMQTCDDDASSEFLSRATLSAGAR